MLLILKGVSAVDDRILERLQRIESQLDVLVNATPSQEWYDTKTVAEILGRSAYSVREWCRLKRLHAEKRAFGRGSSKDWMISRNETPQLSRIVLRCIRFAKRSASIPIVEVKGSRSFA